MKIQPLSSQIFLLSKPVGYTIPVSGFGGKKIRQCIANLLPAFANLIVFGIWIKIYCLGQNNSEESVSLVSGSFHFRYEAVFCLLLVILHVLI